MIQTEPAALKSHPLADSVRELFGNYQSRNRASLNRLIDELSLFVSLEDLESEGLIERLPFSDEAGGDVAVHYERKIPPK